MLCDHRVFFSPESCPKVLSTVGKLRHVPLRQSRPYKPRACFLFRLSLRVDPFLRWPALKRFSPTHRLQLEKPLCVNLFSSSIYHVVAKTGIWGHHEGDKQSIYRRDRKWGQTNTTTDEIMNQSFQTDMRTTRGRLSRVRIGETGNEGNPRP